MLAMKFSFRGLIERSRFLGPEHGHDLLVLRRLYIVLAWPQIITRCNVLKVYLFWTLAYKSHDC